MLSVLFPLLHAQPSLEVTSVSYLKSETALLVLQCPLCAAQQKPAGASQARKPQVAPSLSSDRAGFWGFIHTSGCHQESISRKPRASESPQCQARVFCPLGLLSLL